MASGKEWISVSDLMSVLMMVFLFIAILFMLQVQSEQQEVEQQHQAMAAVATSYDVARNGLHRELNTAFGDKLARWNAEILADGTMRFNHPQALFNVGSSELNDDFRQTLDDFFPRYVAVLSSEEWRDEISEIRIEGHTSSDWSGSLPDNEEDKYIRNAKLSQERAFAVLEYVYQLPAEQQRRMWLRQVLRATGASYAEPVLVEGEEDATRSRRVEFHAMPRADEKIYDILRQL
ncbi:MAG: OmpA family protein [Proteobacteria bacterium]|nr:OmpA family protein [Pseudomonadota bacterium]